jgi:copper chaperone CopZ
LALAFEQLIDPESVRQVLSASGMHGMHESTGLAMVHSAAWWETASAFALIGLLSFFAFEDTQRMFRRKKMATNTDSNIIFSVGGMTCGGCTGRVEKALLAVDGVQSVVVDLEPGQATVVGSASESTLKNAVISIGFTV